MLLDLADKIDEMKMIAEAVVVFDVFFCIAH